MKCLSLVFILALTDPVQNNFLENLKWENRVILLFTGAKEDEMVKEQLSILNSEKDGVDERDLKVFVITASEVRSQSGRNVQNASASDLRSRFKINSSSFTFILLGKDGGVKLREMFTVSSDRIFNLIDSMPMRRREMNNGH